MSLEVTINSVTGTTPYDIYICDPYGNGCFYINRVNSVPYNFIIPKPNDTFDEYMIKILDGNGYTITGKTNVT